MPPERYAVIGDPIEHSLSPAMQTAAFASAGLDAVYEAHRIPPARLAAHMARFREAYAGLNVTIPHKETVLRQLDQVDPVARSLGAANTLVCRGGRLVGYNTDPAGFQALLSGAAADEPGALAVLFGAGGAARAVLHVLLGLGDRVVLVNRDERRAVARAALDPLRVEVVPRDDRRLPGLLSRADIVVNATPLGMRHLAYESPLPPGAALAQRAVAIDLVYGRLTPFLRTARDQGCVAVDGLEMLVQQGAESFRLWTGGEPDIDAMRAACLQQIEEAECSVS